MGIIFIYLMTLVSQPGLKFPCNNYKEINYNNYYYNNYLGLKKLKTTNIIIIIVI